MALFRRASLYVALLSLESFGFPSATADTISTWNGGSGNWSTAGQWTPSAVPNNTANKAYDVTIGNGTVTLDVSPTINSLTLNGGLTTGYYVPTGQYTTLAVNGNATVSGVIGNDSFDGFLDSLAVSGNLANCGLMVMGSDFSVGGNLQNSGSLVLTGVQSASGHPPFFSVGGTLLNTGSLRWGDQDADPGTRTSLGGLVNKGSLFISPGTIVSAPVNDVPKGSSWDTAGTLNGFNPSSIDGAVLLEGSNSMRIGNITQSGSLTLDTAFGGPITVSTSGFSNSGNILIGAEGQSRPDLGSSTLNITGPFVNQASGTLTVNNPQYSLNSPGSLIGQNIFNYGTINFQAGTTSSAQQLVNSGTVNIYGDEAGDIGQLTVGTLKTAGGLTEVWNNGGALIVGSGSVPTGFAGGYYQFADGTLEAAGGELLVEGPVSLNGTLDIMLGDSFKPVGTVFAILYGGPLTGTFSNIDGLIFDDGRERYEINYGGSQADVTLTVENNSTPEPGSAGLIVLGVVGILGTSWVRRQRLYVRQSSC